MNTYDITEVCQMLGTTSRTLRFYEERGIITSTQVPFSARRHYSSEQIEQIKKVIVLRALGLSVAKIRLLLDGNVNLSDAIKEHKVELIASIVSKAKQLRMLDDALSTIEEGGNIYIAKENISISPSDRMDIAETFTELFIKGEYETCFTYFSDMLCEYMPLPVWRRVIGDTLKPIGSFVHMEKIECDPEIPNVVYCYLRYEKSGLLIKNVFHKDQIHGIWLNYYE